MDKDAEKIAEAKHLVWRNLPLYESTFSACACGRANGRGGGRCLQCAQDELAKLVGADLAGQFVAAALVLRHIEKKMEAA